MCRWLLKIDTQGYETKTLRGAAGLFSSVAVANVAVEFTPGMLRDAGDPPASLVEVMKRYGFICFDVRGPSAPWSLSRNRPSAIDEFVEALEQNTREELNQSKRARWVQANGAFDDLACVNVGKVWRGPPVASTRGQGWETRAPELVCDRNRKCKTPSRGFK